MQEIHPKALKMNLAKDLSMVHGEPILFESE